MRGRHGRHRQRHHHREADHRAQRGGDEPAPQRARRQRPAQQQQQRETGAARDGGARRRQEQRIDRTDRQPRRRQRPGKQQDAGTTKRNTESLAGNSHVRRLRRSSRAAGPRTCKARRSCDGFAVHRRPAAYAEGVPMSDCGRPSILDAELTGVQGESRRRRPACLENACRGSADQDGNAVGSRAGERRSSELRPFPAMLRGPIFASMAKSPASRRRQRDPAKHSKKDPAKPTRAKAARPDLAPIEPALAQLLNPGIDQGTAGPGSQTGLQPPPDNSFDRRRDFSDAHRARKSTQRDSSEAPQSGYVAKTPVRRRTRSRPRPRAGIDGRRARVWGLEVPAAGGWTPVRGTTAPPDAFSAGRGSASNGMLGRRPRHHGRATRPRWNRCCARAGRNSTPSRGRRTARRGRRNPRAAIASSSSPSSSRRATSRRRSATWSRA